MDFAEYKVEIEQGITTISLKYIVPRVNKIMMSIGALIIAIMILTRTEGNIILMFYLTVVIGITGIISVLFAQSLNKKKESAQKIIISKDELTLPLENFKVLRTSIKNAKVIEKSLPFSGKLYEIQLELEGGSKTIDFPLSRYDKADEFRQIILKA
jgi:hypothetical protein